MRACTDFAGRGRIGCAASKAQAVAAAPCAPRPRGCSAAAATWTCSPRRISAIAFPPGPEQPPTALRVGQQGSSAKRHERHVESRRAPRKARCRAARPVRGQATCIPDHGATRGCDATRPLPWPISPTAAQGRTAAQRSAGGGRGAHSASCGAARAGGACRGTIPSFAVPKARAHGWLGGQPVPRRAAVWGAGAQGGHSSLRGGKYRAPLSRSCGSRLAGRYHSYAKSPSSQTGCAA